MFAALLGVFATQAVGAVRRRAREFGWMAAGGLFALLALVFVLVAMFFGLERLTGPVAAALILAVGLIVVAAVAYFAGKASGRAPPASNAEAFSRVAVRTVATTAPVAAFNLVAKKPKVGLFVVAAALGIGFVISRANASRKASEG